MNRIYGIVLFVAFAYSRGLIVALAFLVNPLLPMFAVIRPGPWNNNERYAVSEYLPDWLWWFSTNDDNSLHGDSAHWLRHSKSSRYWMMVCWLYRNPAQGFSWRVLGAPVVKSQIEKTWYGYSMGPYFQLILPGNLVFGWLLDASYGSRVPDKMAYFVFGR